MQAAIRGRRRDTAAEELWRFDDRPPARLRDRSSACLVWAEASRGPRAERPSGVGSLHPRVGSLDFQLIIVATLLHDSGFIKQIGDNEGTGAKYILTHVERSQKFAANFLPGFGLTVDEIILIQLFIRCTGVKVDVDRVPFYDDRERFFGWVLGTGDILGQMAAPDYPERLSRLYEEFTEAAAYSNTNGSGIEVYHSAEDLMRQTRDFYEGYVKQLLERQWGEVHKALLHHFDDGKNHYFNSIEANLDHIEREV